MKCNGKRWLRYHYLRVIRQNDTPERIAGGLALGVALGILPSFGLAVIVAIILSGWMRLNRAAAVIGTLIMNPWTTPFFWAVSFLAGSLVLGYDLSGTLDVISKLKSQGDLWSALAAKRLLVPYIVGNLIVTAGSSAFFYVIGFWAVRGYRRAKKERALRKAGGRTGHPDREPEYAPVR